MEFQITKKAKNVAFGLMGFGARRENVALCLQALGDVLRHSNLIATVPERFADRVLEPFGLVKRDLPIPLADSAIHQFWHSRLHRDPGHQWLRQLTWGLFGDGPVPDEEKPI